jgi:hypothetical protein
VLDDSYIPEGTETDYNRCLNEAEFYDQIMKAGYTIIREEIFDRSGISHSDDQIFEAIQTRAHELMNQFPEKKYLFSDYLKMQEHENHMLSNVLASGTWLMRRNI